jgi:hypothetical protein
MIAFTVTYRPDPNTSHTLTGTRFYTDLAAAWEGCRRVLEQEQGAVVVDIQPAEAAPFAVVQYMRPGLEPDQPQQLGLL